MAVSFAGKSVRAFLEAAGKSADPAAAERPMQPAIFGARVGCGSAQGHSCSCTVEAMPDVYSDVCPQSGR